MLLQDLPCFILCMLKHCVADVRVQRFSSPPADVGDTTTLDEHTERVKIGF